MDELPKRFKDVCPPGTIFMWYEENSQWSSAFQVLMAIKMNQVFIRKCESVKQAQNVVKNLTYQVEKMVIKPTPKIIEYSLYGTALSKKFKIMSSQDWVIAVPDWRLAYKVKGE